MIQFNSIRFDSIWFDLIWFDLIRFDSIWFDSIWFDLIWFDSIRFDSIRFDLIWFDSIRFDLIWFDLIWFDSWPLSIDLLLCCINCPSIFHQISIKLQSFFYDKSSVIQLFPKSTMGAVTTTMTTIALIQKTNRFHPFLHHEQNNNITDQSTIDLTY